MPDPVIIIEDSDGVEISSGNPIAFGLREKGTTSPQISIWIWNDKGNMVGADTAVAPQVSAVVGDDDPDVLFDGTSYNGNNSMLQARSCKATGVAADAQDDWTPIRPDQLLVIGNIPANAAREIQLRIVVPTNSSDLALSSFNIQVSV